MYNRRFPFHRTPASGKRLDFIRIMIAIIAEKPSVGQDIARVVGATEKKDGYIVGNGYMVTWALGHLVSLALPDTYGYTRTAAEDLPMIPDPFRLVVRQVRTDRGMVTDIAAGRQLKVIGEVFAGCESIIVATDAGREGGTHLPVDIFLSGLYQAVQTVVDLLAYRRGHPGGNGRPQGRNRI